LPVAVNSDKKYMQPQFGKNMTPSGETFLNRSRDKNFLSIEQARKINYIGW
jgi:hypothetical protein